MLAPLCKNCLPVVVVTGIGLPEVTDTGLGVVTGAGPGVVWGTGRESDWTEKCYKVLNCDHLVSIHK